MPARIHSLPLALSLCVAVVAAGAGAADGLGAPAAAGPAEATAPEDPEVLTDHRQGVMRAVSGHMAASAAILLDGAPFEGNLSLHGTALTGLLEDIPALFPEGSQHEESGARPEVWSNRETFSQRAGVTAERAAAFGEATQGADRMAMVQAFQALGQSCGACHEDFRF
jgi:cytochrome c556